MAEKTWGQKWNYATTTATTQQQQRNIIWFLKAFLRGDSGVGSPPTLGLWTVYYSCDSAVAGSADDQVDRWGTTFDNTKVVRNSAGSAHSWFVLKSPSNFGVSGNGPYYLIIDYVGSDDYHADFIYSKAAPTGGTTLVRPTATDEFGHAGIQTHSSFGSESWNCHGLLSSDGIFWLFVGKVGSGGVNLCLAGQALAEASASDLANLAIYSKYDAASPPVPTNRSNFQTTNNWKIRDYSNTSIQPIKPCTLSDGSNTVHEDIVIRKSDQKYIDLPIYMYIAVAGQRDLRGRLFDIRWGPSVLPEGQVDPSVASPTSTMLGDCWFPANAVPNL